MDKPQIITEVVAGALRTTIGQHEPLEVWFSVRDQRTGEVIYEGSGARGVRCGDTVIVTHRIGDISINDV
jgi:hypothetical protein